MVTFISFISTAAYKVLLSWRKRNAHFKENVLEHQLKTALEKSGINYLKEKVNFTAVKRDTLGKRMKALSSK